MKRLYFIVITLATLMTPLQSESSATADESRLPTVDEVLMLAEQLRDYPPWRSDITVLVEFNLDQIPESVHRRQVKAFIQRDNSDLGLPTEGDEVDAEIEREVQRLLGEQSVPRRIKERWRMDGLSYRVDEVHTITGLEVIDEDTPWASSFLFIWDDALKQAHFAMLDYGQKILTDFGSEYGNVQEYRDVWAGGTLGRSSIQLKAGLGMNVFGEDRSQGPDLDLVQRTANGTHEFFELRVTDVEGQRHGREFNLRPKGGGNIRFTTPNSSFTPIFDVETTDAGGQLIYALISTDVDDDGVVTEWVEKQRLEHSGELREVRITLLDRTIWEELPADTFSLERPRNWMLFEHQDDKVEVTDKDGRKSILQDKSGRAVNVQSSGNSRTLLMYLALANSIACAVIAWTLRWKALRKRPSQ